MTKGKRITPTQDRTRRSIVKLPGLAGLLPQRRFKKRASHCVSKEGMLEQLGCCPAVPLILPQTPSQKILQTGGQGGGPTAWACMHSPVFWRRNPTKTLGFLLPWISPWFFVGFLPSPPPYAKSFLRKPRFLVLADFFFLIFLNPSNRLVFMELFTCRNKDQWIHYFLLYIIKVEHSKEDI